MGRRSGSFKLPREVVLLYDDLNGNFFRLIPTDGRPHRTGIEASAHGDSVGHWEGETLVIEVRNLNAETWLGDNGLFHTEDIRVTERLRREGNTSDVAGDRRRPGGAGGAMEGESADALAEDRRDRRSGVLPGPDSAIHAGSVASRKYSLTATAQRGRLMKRLASVLVVPGFCYRVAVKPHRPGM